MRNYQQCPVRIETAAHRVKQSGNGAFCSAGLNIDLHCRARSSRQMFRTIRRWKVHRREAMEKPLRSTEENGQFFGRNNLRGRNRKESATSRVFLSRVVFHPRDSRAQITRQVVSKSRCYECWSIFAPRKYLRSRRKSHRPMTFSA